MAGQAEGKCVVCGERITMTGWTPFCCEVCFDSADADEQRLLERGIVTTGMTGAPCRCCACSSAYSPPRCAQG